jgi:hypothetical protein
MAIVIPSRKTSGKQAPQPSIGEKAQRNTAGGASAARAVHRRRENGHQKKFADVWNHSKQ